MVIADVADPVEAQKVIEQLDLVAPLFGAVARRGVLSNRDVVEMAKLVEKLGEIGCRGVDRLPETERLGRGHSRAEVLARYESLLGLFESMARNFKAYETLMASQRALQATLLDLLQGAAHARKRRALVRERQLIGNALTLLTEAAAIPFPAPVPMDGLEFGRDALAEMKGE